MLGSPPETNGWSEWTQQYRDGRWDHLASAREAIRYQTIAADICSQSEAAVLDLGCGSCLLYRALGGPGFPGRYVGVDWSLTALPREGWGTGHYAICGDLAALPVRGLFDVIVLNEVLYYLDHPADVLARLPSFLSQEGKLLISMFQPNDARKQPWRRFVDDLAGHLARQPGARRRVMTDGDRTWVLYVIHLATTVSFGSESDPLLGKR